MPKFTENFELEMPNQDEYYNIDVHNENMKKIDTAIKKIADDSNKNEVLSSIKQNTDIIKSDTANIKSNVQSIKTDTTNIKSDTTIIKNNIGNTNDSVGSSTTGSLSAKLNKLLSDWTSTRAGYLTNIYNHTSKIGNNSDSGGSTSAGSVMAKLNKLLTDWTTTRASKLDSIGNTNDSSSSGTSTGGTIMAKLNKLLTDWTTTRASKLDSIGNTNDSSSSGTSTGGTIMAKLNKIITLVSRLETFTTDATAINSDLLSGKTAYVNWKKVTGTMSNNNAVQNKITTQNGSYTIPKGYHNGSGKVTAVFSNLTSSNIKKDINIGGVVGSLIPSNITRTLIVENLQTLSEVTGATAYIKTHLGFGVLDMTGDKFLAKATSQTTIQPQTYNISVTGEIFIVRHKIIKYYNDRTYFSTPKVVQNCELLCHINTFGDDWDSNRLLDPVITNADMNSYGISIFKITGNNPKIRINKLPY